ncbi:PTS sugar transporter subunit IIA [Brevibacillus fulvus]
MEQLIELDERAVQLGIEGGSDKDVIVQMYRRLRELDYVEESYLAAVLEREQVYPTGLPLADQLGVAIPHTDAIHVRKPAIGVGQLRTPVAFQVMGSPGQTIDTHLVFMLAVKDPQQQITMLERLMGMFQQRAVMAQLKNAAASADVIRLMQEQLNLA